MAPSRIRQTEKQLIVTAAAVLCAVVTWSVAALNAASDHTATHWYTVASLAAAGAVWAGFVTLKREPGIVEGVIATLALIAGILFLSVVLLVLIAIATW